MLYISVLLFGTKAYLWVKLKLWVLRYCLTVQHFSQYMWSIFMWLVCTCSWEEIRLVLVSCYNTQYTIHVHVYTCVSKLILYPPCLRWFRYIPRPFVWAHAQSANSYRRLEDVSTSCLCRGYMCTDIQYCKCLNTSLCTQCMTIVLHSAGAYHWSLCH